VLNVPLHRLVSESFRNLPPLVVQIAIGAIILSSFVPWVRKELFENQQITVAVIGSLAILAFRTLLSAAERHPTGAVQTGRIVLMGDLGAELAKFASVRECSIDVFAYSTETFLPPLETLFDALEKVGHPPRSVAIRILMKDWDTLRLPPRRSDINVHDQRSIDQYISETAGKNKRMAQELLSKLDDIAVQLREKRDIELTFAIRLYPFDPFHKGIIVDRNLAFCSLYSVSNKIFTGRPEIWDWQGKGVHLIEIRADGSPSEAQYLKSLTDWFDVVWEGFGVDLTEKLQSSSSALLTRQVSA
jgi:hypothetical protein